MRIVPLFTLASLLLLAACSTPSVHPIYTDADPPPAEPGLAGTWKGDDESVSYTLTREGDGYALLVREAEPDDPDGPRQWPFEVRLTQVGEHRFADIAAPEDERGAQDEKWGPLFVPTHLFARYKVEGDTLRVWIIDRDWLRAGLRDGGVTLAHTWLGPETVLLTAQTPQLREFLARFGADPQAFPHQTVLKRQR